MTADDLSIVRDWLKEHIFRDGNVMLSDKRYIEVYGDPGEVMEIDMCEVIASLYELLHCQVCNEPYSYFFHWANKCGSDVDCTMFIDMILCYGGKKDGT